MEGLEVTTRSLYDYHLRDWRRLLASVSRRLNRLLERPGLRYSLRSRVKEFGSLVAKQQRLVKANGEIRDLLGIRIVVPFLEDVEEVLEVVTERFDVVAVDRKSDGLSFREFAYDSVHVVVDLPRATGLEWPAGCSRTCEIQIRTILQDAWAEVEHELIYKSDLDVPDASVRKKLAALNANLTLSDTIFQEIRDHQRELSRWGRERFHELQRRAGAPEPDLMAGKVEVVPARDSTGSHERKLSEALVEALRAHNDHDYRRAVRLYSRCLDLGPGGKIRSTIYNHRGMAQFMLEREREALADFDESCRCDPDNYRAFNNRALILRRMGHVQQALEDFARSLAIRSQQPEVHVLRAQTRVEIGEFEAALVDVEAALVLAPEDAEARDLRRRILEAAAGS